MSLRRATLNRRYLCASAVALVAANACSHLPFGEVAPTATAVLPASGCRLCRWGADGHLDSESGRERPETAHPRPGPHTLPRMVARRELRRRRQGD
jgi:hypothetical protein